MSEGKQLGDVSLDAFSSLNERWGAALLEIESLRAENTALQTAHTEVGRQRDAAYKREAALRTAGDRLERAAAQPGLDSSRDNRMALRKALDAWRTARKDTPA